MNELPPSIDIPEAGQTRAGFLRKAGLGSAALVAGGALLATPGTAVAGHSDAIPDVDILNFALTLEYLESAFYTMANKEVKDLSGQAKTIAQTLDKDEKAHVDALTKTIKDLGGTPVKAPGVDFGPAFANQKSFLKLAQTFEDTGVSAYNGAGPSIKDKAILGTAGSIVQIEARHAAAIRLMNGETPAPEAFDKSLDMQAVLTAVKPFVTS